jgi:hypothetical protein
MVFTFVVFLAALLIEGLASLISVIGISSLFGANLIIIAMAIALDYGKIVTVSLMYNDWKTFSNLRKFYSILACVVTMTITSAGAAGYLSGEFSKAMLSSREGELKVSILKEQQQKYQERKNQIDNQIANLPERTSVNQRLRLINGFKAEQQNLDQKISEIDKQLPEVQINQINLNAKAGYINALARVLNVPIETAINYIIFLIVIVFDPLAVFLIVSGNARLKSHKEEKERKQQANHDKLINQLKSHEASTIPVIQQPIVSNVNVTENKPIVQDIVTTMQEEKQIEDLPIIEPPPEPIIENAKHEVEEDPKQMMPVKSSLTDVMEDPSTTVDAAAADPLGFVRPKTHYK